ncbi:MAG: hypothetical protein IJH71_08465 [Eubacterium sp.]|nr:hypothetical protein [Eubacterium sp.]
MKRLISISLIALLIMSAFVLTSCGSKDSDVDLSDSKYLGTWKAKGISAGDESEELEEEYIMTLKEDGTGTLSGEDETSEFTWKPVDGGFKTKGDLKVKFVDDGDNIKTKILGVDLVFERE